MRFTLLILFFSLFGGASEVDRFFEANGQASARWDFAESADREQWRLLGNLEIQPGPPGALFVGTGNDPSAEPAPVHANLGAGSYPVAMPGRAEQLRAILLGRP